MSKSGPPEVPVRFYQTEASREPVREWLRELETGDRRAIGLDLSAGTVRLADWNAAGAGLEEWLVGGPIFIAEQADCETAAVLSRKDAHCSAWIY